MEYCRLQSKRSDSKCFDLVTECQSILYAHYVPANALGERFHRQYGLTDTLILRLMNLDVMPINRNHGEGTFLMNSLVEILDCEKLWIINNVNPHTATSRKRLRGFFLRFGFEDADVFEPARLIRRPRIMAERDYESKSP